jgi:hypothetical protein
MALNAVKHRKLRMSSVGAQRQFVIEHSWQTNQRYGIPAALVDGSKPLAAKKVHLGAVSSQKTCITAAGFVLGTTPHAAPVLP